MRVPVVRRRAENHDDEGRCPANPLHAQALQFAIGSSTARKQWSSKKHESVASKRACERNLRSLEAITLRSLCTSGVRSLVRRWSADRSGSIDQSRSSSLLLSISGAQGLMLRSSSSWHAGACVDQAGFVSFLQRLLTCGKLRLIFPHL